MWRVERIGNATLYLGDCMEILPTLGKIDAVVTDPPYGTGCGPRGGNVAGTIDFDSAPFIAWDKFDLTWVQCIADVPLAVFCHHGMAAEVGGAIGADAIFAYIKSNPTPFGTSWEACPARGFSRMSPQHVVAYNAFNGQLHETQKPLGVMEFVVGRAPGLIILDPFMGSGTTGVACAKLGRQFIGIEIEPKYFDIACRRIAAAHRQLDLFNDWTRPEPVTEQIDMAAIGAEFHEAWAACRAKKLAAE